MILAVFGEDLRYRFARTPHDDTVEVHELEAQGTGQQQPQGGLAATHVPDDSHRTFQASESLPRALDAFHVSVVAARMSVMLSIPNFSRNASASTMAAMDSPITAAAGTAHESARSLKARVGSPVARSTVRRALAMVEMGFIAAAITTGSPFVIPPSNPPRRLLLRARRPFSESISSCTSLDLLAASSKPIPNSTPLIALIDIMAAASLASSLSRQST